MIESIFIFRRDHRIKDNKALNACFDASDSIIPIFIFDPKQLNNQYKSDKAINFMIESLLDLSKALDSKLYINNGKPYKVVEKLLEENPKVSSVYVSADYTPYSKKRDVKIEKICNKKGISFVSINDSLLLSELKYNKAGSTYKVYTPFYNAFKRLQIDKPTSKPIINKISSKYKFVVADIKKYSTEDVPEQSGGRSNGLMYLKLVKKQEKYVFMRDTLNYETTRLSPYLNFGNISIRETYQAVRKIKDKNSRQNLIKQLFWRDFYAGILSSSGSSEAYFENWRNLPWNKSSTWLSKWQDGTTGFPVVDAGMRQLNTTGYMHNRSRMIVASFLSKDMLINWQLGEKYFSKKLTDTSYSQNNGNWQNVIGCSPFSLPYFRVFNPWEQSKKYDAECKYIKNWIPELDKVPAEHIHKWYEYYDQYNVYLKPILDHNERKEEYIDWVKKHIYV